MQEEVIDLDNVLRRELEIRPWSFQHWRCLYLVFKELPCGKQVRLVVMDLTQRIYAQHHLRPQSTRRHGSHAAPLRSAPPATTINMSSWISCREPTHDKLIPSAKIGTCMNWVLDSCSYKPKSIEYLLIARIQPQVSLHTFLT